MRAIVVSEIHLCGKGRAPTPVLFFHVLVILWVYFKRRRIHIPSLTAPKTTAHAKTRHTFSTFCIDCHMRSLLYLVALPEDRMALATATWFIMVTANLSCRYTNGPIQGLTATWMPTNATT
jgi:hypothetical protein